MPLDKREIKVLKAVFKDHYTELTLEQIEAVLTLLGDKEDAELCDFLSIKISTLRDWRSGKHEPNGANKAVFNYILFSNGIKKIK